MPGCSGQEGTPGTHAGQDSTHYEVVEGVLFTWPMVGLRAAPHLHAHLHNIGRVGGVCRAAGSGQCGDSAVPWHLLGEEKGPSREGDPGRKGESSMEGDRRATAGDLQPSRGSVGAR